MAERRRNHDVHDCPHVDCHRGAALTRLAAPFAAEPHEARTVGSYEMVVGLLDEPALAGEKNELDPRDSEVGASPPAIDAAAAVPVKELDETLQAEVIIAELAMPLEIEATWTSPGEYESVFVPMEPGDYTFRIFGTIDGTELDESLTLSPEGFSAVRDPEPSRPADPVPPAPVFGPLDAAGVALATVLLVAGAVASGVAERRYGIPLGFAGVAAGVALPLLARVPPAATPVVSAPATISTIVAGGHSRIGAARPSHGDARDGDGSRRAPPDAGAASCPGSSPGGRRSAHHPRGGFGLGTCRGGGDRRRWRPDRGREHRRFRSARPASERGCRADHRAGRTNGGRAVRDRTARNGRRNMARHCARLAPCRTVPVGELARGRARPVNPQKHESERGLSGEVAGPRNG